MDANSFCTAPFISFPVAHQPLSSFSDEIAGQNAPRCFYRRIRGKILRSKNIYFMEIYFYRTKYNEKNKFFLRQRSKE